MTDSYNDWSNWETWITKLWIGEHYDYWRGIIARYIGKANKEEALRDLATWLKDEHEEHLSSATEVRGVYFDLLSAALHKVNWEEIARHLLEEV